MATNLEIDQVLLNRAVEVTGARSKREAVTIALEELIARRRQASIVDHFGRFDWDPEYDYRADRAARDRKRSATN